MHAREQPADTTPQTPYFPREDSRRNIDRLVSVMEDIYLKALPMQFVHRWVSLQCEFMIVL